MIKREIYQVLANIVDANGTFNALSGYPKIIDSKHYNNDLEKTRQRAYGEYHEVLAAMCKIDSRQLQIASIIRVSDNLQIALECMGQLADLPDPEPDEQA